MIIFGFSGRTKDLGEAVPTECPRCHNQVFFHLMTRTRWFSLFFIPLIPYSSRHLLVCPICGYAAPAEGEARELAGRLVQLTSQWRAGALSEEAYRAAVAEFIKGEMHMPSPGLPPAGAAPEPPPIPPPPGASTP